jgi:lysophospholipid acyltransferase (LPLAT)-like uncharacterized protein
VTEVRAGEGSRKRFLIDAEWFRYFVGYWVMAPYVRFVVATSKRTFFPPDHFDVCAAAEPAIYLTWHANLLGQFAAVARTDHLTNMTSPHPDGRMAGALSNGLGVETIVAEGGFGEKGAAGGVAGFRAMLRNLKEGRSLILTGEVPPQPGRQIAQGIIAVAKLSGRPIIPIGIASTRQKIIERLWDRLQVNYPWGRMFIVSAPPITIARSDDDVAAALKVKSVLDAVYAEAMAKADAARRAGRR